MNAELHYQISQFLYHEAYLLDHRKYKDWLDLLSDDITYRMPLRVTTENRDGSNLVEDMTYFEESKSSLVLRVERLYTNSAWVDDPAPRQRHFISNIMVDSNNHPDELKVRSYILFKRNRASEIHTEEIFCEREDIFRKEAGKWKIVKRTIYPDQTVLTVMNLSMFL